MESSIHAHPGRGLVVLSLLICLGASAIAQADQVLTVYHSWDDQVTRSVLDAFSAETGIAARGMRRSTRHLVKIIEAERDAPVASVVMAGSAPSYEMLKAAGLLTPYTPVGADAIPAEFRDPEGYWTGFYLGVLGFASDASRVPAAPQSFDDLLSKPWPGGLVYANPATSGTAYTLILTLIALQGEDQAFATLKRLNPKVIEYPSGGAMPVKLVELGEADVAIAFAHDIVRAQQTKPNLRLSFPAEGTGWEVGAAGLLKGAPAAEAGKRFLDYLMRADVQERIASQAGMPVYPTHSLAAAPKGMPELDSIKRISIDPVEAGKNWDARAKRFNRLIPR